jgi:transcriptional regulator with XRE-family HTH domain
MPHASREAAAAQKQFGRRLREARLAAGLTQAQLAELAGVNAPHLSEIERGLQNIRMKTMVALARVVGMDIDVVLKPAPTRKRRGPKE